MAFDNVTLFEVHLDDAKLTSIFGAADADEDRRDDEMVVEAASDEETMDAATSDAEMDVEGSDDAAVVPSRGRGFVRFVAVAAVVGIAYAVVRRRRGGDAMNEDDTAYVGMADDVEHVEVDEAAPQ